MSVEHVLVAPIVLPLVAGSLALLTDRRAPRVAALISVTSVLVQLALAIYLVALASDGAVRPYLLGNWQAPYGIALALDRLSALMLLLTALIGVFSVIYARGDDGKGPHDARALHFHALLQFQLMGLAGAFLTADLFNLFVFFEVLLVASYGLLLYGGGAQRLKASIHYVVFNLAGSTLFLFAIALLYGVTGTLNMADLAQRVSALGPDGATLVRAGALMLLVVFGVKAALLPLYFWLPDTYRAASAPVAALFAIMTKVGIYCIARVTTLIFGADAGPVANLASPWLPWLAMGTLTLGAFGTLAATRLRTLAAYLVVTSAGTLLLAIGLGQEGTIGAALFYLVHSTLIGAALFLLVDTIASARGEADDEMRPAPLASRAGLGALFFVFAIAAAGMPPFGGFLGKALLLTAILGTNPGADWTVATWAVVLLSSLGMMVALARAGSTVFWKATEANRMLAAAARASAPERGALALLLVGVLAVSAFAAPLSRYTQAAAAQLLEPRAYVSAVLGARPIAPLWNPREGLIKP